MWLRCASARAGARSLSTQAHSFDTVIVGGGAIGASIAVHLALRGLGKKTIVLERDPALTLNSAMRSAGGIRQQFSVPENIKMSMYGAAFLADAAKTLHVDGDAPVDVQYKPNGYLFLAADDKGRQVLQTNHRTQRAQGVSWVDLLERAELVARYPWLHADDLALGSAGRHGGGEGYFDPWSLVVAMRKKAQSLGVEFRAAEAVGAGFDAHTRRMTHVDILPAAAASSSSPPQQQRIHGGVFCNALGAWASRLVDLVGTSASAQGARVAALPVEARKRCIFRVECALPSSVSASATAPVPPPSSPLTVDPSGVYFRPEGSALGHFICGVSPADTPADDPPHAVGGGAETDARALECVAHELFDDVVWPTLAARVPAFGALKVRSAWAGFYEHNTLDQNALIGAHADIRNLMLCNGFSGHGLQQSPAAGRAVAELIATGGRFETIDLSRFAFERVARQAPVWETGIV